MTECTMALLYNIGISFMLASVAMKLLANHSYGQDKTLWLTGSLLFPSGGSLTLPHLFTQNPWWHGVLITILILLSLASSIYQYIAGWRYRRY